MRVFSLARRSAPWLALAAALAIYFGIGAYELREPGLFYDEAFDAIPSLQMLQGDPVECVETASVLGHELPVMMHPHIGATTAYTSLAGMIALGPTVEALRLSQLAVGALGLVLLFLLARSWFDGRTAAIAALLCGTAPAFVWWSRGGANWTVPLLPISLGMLLALDRWWRTGRTRTLFVAAFLAGFGITTKILFVWLALPMLLTGLLAIGPRRILAAVRPAPFPAIAASSLGFALGLAPLLAHNVPEPNTLHHVLRSAVTTKWGHDNRAFSANLRFIVEDFLRTLGGSVHMGPPIDGPPLVAVIAIGALVYEILQSRRTRGTLRDGAAPRAFLVLVPLTVLPQSTVTTSALSSTYLFLIVPLVWLLVAVALADLLRRFRPRTAAWAGALALLLALLASHVAANLDLLRFFRRTGGYGQWSDAIYRIADVLERDFAGRTVIALDWGFARNLEYLTERRLRVVEGHEFRPVPTEGFEGRCRELLAVPDAVYLAHDESFATCRGCFRQLAAVAHADGRELALARALHDREGRVHTRIYEVAGD